MSSWALELLARLGEVRINLENDTYFVCLHNNAPPGYATAAGEDPEAAAVNLVRALLQAACGAPAALSAEPPGQMD